MGKSQLVKAVLPLEWTFNSKLQADKIPTLKQMDKKLQESGDSFFFVFFCPKKAFLCLSYFQQGKCKRFPAFVEALQN